MSSRLEHILSWNELARRAGYSSNRLAKICGVSQRVLQRHFQHVFRIRVKQWLWDLKLTDAKQLLSPTKSIQHIAAQLGYKQPAHFINDFKKKYGVTPYRCARNCESNPMLEACFDEINNEYQRYRGGGNPTNLNSSRFRNRWRV
jgi:AraC-like DNA-binding protein